MLDEIGLARGAHMTLALIPEPFMYTLIAVIVLLMVGAAIAMGVAFYLGLFRLGAVPTENRGQFILMRKKEPIRDDPKNAPLKANGFAQPPAQDQENN